LDTFEATKVDGELYLERDDRAYFPEKVHDKNRFAMFYMEEDSEEVKEKRKGDNILKIKLLENRD
jgi:hypothetical protein